MKKVIAYSTCVGPDLITISKQSGNFVTLSQTWQNCPTWQTSNTCFC